jgi:hypothetical protein
MARQAVQVKVAAVVRAKTPPAEEVVAEAGPAVAAAPAQQAAKRAARRSLFSS